MWTGGRKLKVNVAPTVEGASLRRGQEVPLNEALNVVAAGGRSSRGRWPA